MATVKTSRVRWMISDVIKFALNKTSRSIFHFRAIRNDYSNDFPGQ